MKLKKDKLTREDTLNAKPLRNQALKEAKEDGGDIILIAPRKKVKWVSLLTKMFYIPGERKVRLDKIGSWVWERCDGKTSISKMIECLAGEFKISPKEAEISLLSFLKQLAQKRLIGFVIQK